MTCWGAEGAFCPIVQLSNEDVPDLELMSGDPCYYWPVAN